MNYRHAYHVGNFADVLKHAVIALCLQRLRAKEKPFFALDTHAGVGWYDLTSHEATRSPEWRGGAAKVLAGLPRAPDAVRAALAPYLDALRAANPDADDLATGLRWYPGSCALLADGARGQDRVVACELHSDDARALADALADRPQAQVEARDGYGAIKALLPPAERRGLVLVDPPYEHVDEMYFLAQAAKEAITRWETGAFVFWRPLKDLWAAERFDVGLAEWLLGERGAAPEKLLRADVWVRELDSEGPLAGAGVVIVNPPFGLDEGLLALLPWLAATLAQGPGHGWRLDGAFTDASLSVDEF